MSSEKKKVKQTVAAASLAPMDLVSLLEDHWESHSPVQQPNQKPRHGKSPSALNSGLPLLTGSPVSDVSPPQQASLLRPLSLASSFESTTSRLPSVTSEELEALTAALTSPLPSETGASLSQDSLKNASTGLERNDALKSGIVVSSRQYEDGLGPAPPIVTAFLLLVAPVWLPILVFFLLPLICFWALVAGKTSSDSTPLLGLLRFTMHSTGWQHWYTASCKQVASSVYKLRLDHGVLEDRS